MTSSFLSTTFEEHVKHIEKVVEVIEKMGIKISPKKCKLAFESLTALGHVVSGLRISIDQNKVAPILQQLMPQNVKQV